MGASTHLKMIRDVTVLRIRVVRNNHNAERRACDPGLGSRDTDHRQYETVRKVHRIGRLADPDKQIGQLASQPALTSHAATERRGSGETPERDPLPGPVDRNNGKTDQSGGSHRNRPCGRGLLKPPRHECATDDEAKDEFQHERAGERGNGGPIRLSDERDQGEACHCHTDHDQRIKREEQRSGENDVEKHLERQRPTHSQHRLYKPRPVGRRQEQE